MTQFYGSMPKSMKLRNLVFPRHKFRRLIHTYNLSKQINNLFFFKDYKYIYIIFFCLMMFIFCTDCRLGFQIGISIISSVEI